MVDHSQLIQVSGTSVCTALSWPMSANHGACNLCLTGLCVKNLLLTPTSLGKYFSTHHRPFSTPAPVQRYMDIFMPKSKAGSLGRSFTSYCGGQDFISPTRELQRSEEKQVTHPHDALYEDLKQYLAKTKNRSLCVSSFLLLTVHCAESLHSKHAG